MQIDRIWDMVFQIVDKGRSHVYDTNGGMMDDGCQFCRLDESGVVKMLQWRRCGIGEIRNEKEKQEDFNFQF